MKFSKIVATVFGLGYLPIAPGTFGALFGLFVSYLLSLLLPYPLYFQIIHIILIIIAYFLGVYACKKLEKEWGHDPSKVVIDETLGYWISILFLPINFYILFAGFILFRFFDILKPLGIRKLDNLKSSHSVMLDDVLAGIYSNFVLQICVYLYY
jgi:phosphatidylglycerophosphatase A